MLSISLVSYAFIDSRGTSIAQGMLDKEGVGVSELETWGKCRMTWWSTIESIL